MARQENSVSFSNISKLWKSQIFDNHLYEIEGCFSKSEISDLPYSFGDNFSYAINHVNADFEGFSKSIVQVLGYEISDLKRIGYENFLKKIHPDDYEKVINIFSKKYKVFTSLDLDNKKNLRCTYTCRIKKNNGTYVKLLNQEYIIKIDTKGNLIYSLTVCTDISSINLNSTLNFEITTINDNHKLKPLREKKTNNLPLFSEREIQVLNEVSKGRKSREIGLILGISMHTVNVHRKNLMKKANVNNVTGLLCFAKKHGIT